MAMKYQLTVDELITFFCEGAPAGIAETELEAAERRLGARLPKRYRDYILLCGAEGINDVYNHMNAPAEISTSYEMLQYEMEDRADEFEEAKQRSEEANFEGNDYFRLYCLPKERWTSLTQNYVLIWFENQGVWNAGYLLSDLLEGKEDPPVYMSTDDDFISFSPLYGNTEYFLLEMLREAAWELGERLVKSDEILYTLSEKGVDINRLKAGYEGQFENGCCCMGTCLDADRNKLYLYFETGDYVELQIVEQRASGKEE